MPPDEESRFCPCAVCVATNPTSVAPAHFRIDFPLVSGTLRLHLCKEHDAYAQKVVGLLVPVPPEPVPSQSVGKIVEDAEEGEDDGTDRDTL